MPTGGVLVVPVAGVPEVRAGDDLAALLVAGLGGAGLRLEPGDCLVVSSKVVSKALGLTWPGERADAVAHHTRRVVAERVAGSGTVTRVVESVAGPVMAAAGVDASNTGEGGSVLLLPEDCDAEAARLLETLRRAAGMAADAPLAVVLSDTAGRPWRQGLTDLALGAAGLAVVEDLRGGVDHDGRELAVTVRALADEVASAADLVKGKADGVPAALVRGLPAAWVGVGPGGSAAGPSVGSSVSWSGGARGLVRTGPGDWFATGHVEALRAALGAEPGSAQSEAVGIRSVAPEPLGDRVGRCVALALLEVPDGSADVEVRAGAHAEVVLGAPDPYELGRLVVRLEVAARSEDLTATVAERGPTSVTVHLSPT